MKTSILTAILLGLGFLYCKAGEPDKDPKKAALTVLEQKCNICHRTNNPGKVFTIDNMESLAPKIYKQVFVKQRMPKGRDIKLTEQESQILRSWVETRVM